MLIDAIVLHALHRHGHDPDQVVAAMRDSNAAINAPEWVDVDFGSEYAAARHGLPRSPYGRFRLQDGLKAVQMWITTIGDPGPALRYTSAALREQPHRHAQLVAEGFAFPDTMTSAIIGKPIGEIVEHPDLDVPGLVVLGTRILHGGTATGFDLSTPMMVNHPETMLQQDA